MLAAPLSSMIGQHHTLSTRSGKCGNHNGMKLIVHVSRSCHQSGSELIMSSATANGLQARLQALQEHVEGLPIDQTLEDIVHNSEKEYRSKFSSVLQPLQSGLSSQSANMQSSSRIIFFAGKSTPAGAAALAENQALYKSVDRRTKQALLIASLPGLKQTASLLARLRDRCDGQILSDQVQRLSPLILESELRRLDVVTSNLNEQIEAATEQSEQMGQLLHATSLLKSQGCEAAGACID